LARKTEILPDGHVGIERIGLKDHRDLAVARIKVGHIPVADEDLAARRQFKTGDHPQRGGLSAAGRADEDDELSGGDLQIEGFHHGEVAEALA
jgi:hypothetical protein